MGSFWSLAAVFGLRATGTTDFVPLFISANVIGGALAQYPVGLISDRVDRRFVLAGLAIITAGGLFTHDIVKPYPLVAGGGGSFGRQQQCYLCGISGKSG